MKKTSIIAASAFITLIGGATMAQSMDSSVAQTRNDALNESIAEDFKRQEGAVGNRGRKLGFQGSMALQSSATSGNTKTSSVGIGMNLGYFDGTNGYKARLNYQFASDDEETTKNDLRYDLGYTRDFGPSYYGFAKLQGSVKELPFETSDNYLGLGVGYRIYDTAKTQWSVQAGVGYRVANLNNVDDLGEGAVSLSSNYYNVLSDTVTLTNDTDIISSESDTVIYNDLGLNVSMTKALALRTSLVTEYHTDPQPGFEDTDNTFGVSLVYSLN